MHGVVQQNGHSVPVASASRLLGRLSLLLITPCPSRNGHQVLHMRSLLLARLVDIASQRVVPYRLVQDKHGAVHVHRPFA